MTGTGKRPGADAQTPVATTATPVTGPDPGDLLGFLFDPNRCTGCSACALACSTENDLGWGTSWRQVIPVNPERRPGVPSFHVSLACNHCADAPCVTHCPTGAMRRDPETGSVVVNADTCIGCRYCSWVCPYDAPRFDADEGVMTKCTLCNHRLVQGMQPACVDACPTAALGYGSVADPTPGRDFPPDPIRPRLGLTALHRNSDPPESTWTLPADVLAAFGPGAQVKSAGISFQGEFPLWLFTSGIAGLAGWVMAAVVGGGEVSLPAFIVIAGLLLLVSTLHLGRRTRAWRAIANVRTSHLSREIVGVNTFLGAAVLWSGWAGPPSAALGTVVAVLGLLALFLVDRVYDPVRPVASGRLHSGDTLLIGPALAAVLLQNPWLFWPLAAVKLALYLRRHRTTEESTRVLWSALRIAGLLLPPLLWIVVPTAWPGWPVLVFATGELLDRTELYRGLRVRLWMDRVNAGIFAAPSSTPTIIRPPS